MVRRPASSYEIQNMRRSALGKTKQVYSSAALCFSMANGLGLPNPPDPKCIQLAVIAQQSQVFKQGLRRENAIEGILVSAF